VCSPCSCVCVGQDEWVSHFITAAGPTAYANISGKPKRHSTFVPTRHSIAIARGLSLRFYLIAEIVASPRHTHTRSYSCQNAHRYRYTYSYSTRRFLRKRCLSNFFHNATKHCNIFLWPHIFLLSYSFVSVPSGGPFPPSPQRFSKTFSEFQSRYEF